MQDTLLSIGKASKALGVSIDTVRRWNKAGRLQSVRSGPRGHRYFRKSDINIFLRDTEAVVRQLGIGVIWNVTVSRSILPHPR